MFDERSMASTSPRKTRAHPWLSPAQYRATALPMEPAGKSSLVIASPVIENRKRWGHKLQETFAICEVAERKALEQVVVNLRPHILVLDLALPHLGRVRGVPYIQRLSPSTRTLVLSDAPTEAEAIAAFKVGAKGYCSRAIDGLQLKKVAQVLHKGGMWVQRELIPSLVAELVSLTECSQKDANVNPGLEGLTTRQRLVADLITRGACNKDIAKRLNISERTVKAHLTEVFRNFGVSDRLQLALLLSRRATEPRWSADRSRPGPSKGAGVAPGSRWESSTTRARSHEPTGSLSPRT
jgi:DNA-binding NarL/FixJ family response regulator